MTPKKGVVGNAERGLPQDSYREEKWTTWGDFKKRKSEKKNLDNTGESALQKKFT